MPDAYNITGYIKRMLDVTDDEADIFESYFKETRVKKGQHIVQPDFIARYRTYVSSGVLRAYVIDNNGADHTISFAIDDWWISDVNSYIYQQPATMFVTALEDSILYQLTFEKEQELKKLNYKYETFFRMMAERAMAFQQKRIISNLTHTAEERYDYFMIKYPAIAARIPQYALASYLGMTTQYLTKIRKRKTKVKLVSAD